MNRLKKTLVLLTAVLLSAELTSAQSSEMLSTSQPSAVKSDSASQQVALLQERKKLLQQRLFSLPPASPEYNLAANWFRELDLEIAELTNTMPSVTISLASAPRVPAQGLPDFALSRPVQGATNEIAQLVLGWTEDQQTNKAYVLRQYIVEVSESPDKLANGRFSNSLFIKGVAPSGVSGQSIPVPKDVLRTGQKYYWQVLAEFVPQGSEEAQLVGARNAPHSFQTVAQTFGRLEDLGLTLQRAVAGDDATEGAQFGFLKTYNKQTVFTADFALIYNKLLKLTQRSAYSFQTSVQGSLTSDESESEDAFQFRAGLVIDRNLKRNTINHLYTSLAIKHEADQKFRVGKLISENMVTPTFPVLGIGVPFGRSSDPIQFRWRPFFYFDVGRNFKRGDSAEVEETVLRLTPRVRTTLALNFLRRALNLNDSFIFADNFFYFLPLEKSKTRHNMFTSGFVLQVTKDFGFGITYKSGEAAPKFKPVHTLGGVLTIRFGKE